MNENYKNFLRDFGYWLREEAFESKKVRDKEADKSGRDSVDYHFAAGELLAYRGVISYIQQQAEHFDLDLKLLRLDDVSPDRDLT